jgi:hypothetical protein
MSELELIRDNLIGIRAQVNAALAQLERVMAALAAQDEEPEEDAVPRTFGSR